MYCTIPVQKVPISDHKAIPYLGIIVGGHVEKVLDKLVNMSHQGLRPALTQLRTEGNQSIN